MCFYVLNFDECLMMETDYEIDGSESLESNTTFKYRGVLDHVLLHLTIAQLTRYNYVHHPCPTHSFVFHQREMILISHEADADTHMS